MDNRDDTLPAPILAVAGDGIAPVGNGNGRLKPAMPGFGPRYQRRQFRAVVAAAGGNELGQRDAVGSVGYRGPFVAKESLRRILILGFDGRLDAPGCFRVADRLAAGVAVGTDRGGSGRPRPPEAGPPVFRSCSH